MKHLKHLFILIIITLFALAISPVDKAVQAVSKESASTDSEVSFLINNKTNALERANDDTDVFGYTRSGPVTNSWIDAGSGTDTGIDCDTVKSTGAIPIGFTFDYYEFSYSELYISCYGYISFNNTNLERTQPRSIPSIETPNAVIAPLWTMAESINYVHYQTLGSSPNRQFIIEWNDFTTDSGQHHYTFEVILHENGNITFQYDAMSDFDEGYSRYGGVENSLGNDGLESYYSWYDFPANSAERFIRPADHANPVLSPDSQGGFMTAGETIAYPISLKNYGSIGTDDFTISTDSDWDIALFESNGTTPLTNPITLAQGADYSFVAAVTAPLTVTPTETNVAAITATSGHTPSVSSSVQIVNTFPAPFVQYMDGEYDDNQQSTINVLPGSLAQVNFIGEGVEGDTAVIELPNHNLFYAWTEQQCIGDDCNYYEAFIKYIILDPTGSAVTYPAVLVDTTVMENDVRDTSVRLAVSPDGDIGILWHREIYDRANYESNNNAFFAILSQDGTGFIMAPQNLTNNDDFCPYYESSCVNQHFLMLAGTPDGNFFLQWREKPAYNYVFKIYNDSTGTLSPTYSLINAASESEYIGNITLTGLENNRYFIAWSYENLVCVTEDDCTWEAELRYIVFNSDGSIANSLTSIPDLWLSEPDSVQLSNGNIIVAHDNSPDTSFILFDGSTYEPITPMTLIPGQKDSWSPGCVSVVKGPYGTAVLTWQSYPEEEDIWEIFYTLIDSDGTVKTPPLAFFETGYESSNYYNYITSDYGQGSTTLDYDYTPIFTSTPTTTAYTNVAYTYTITTDDGNLPDDTLTITCITKPDWLSFSDNGDGTATLTGMTDTEDSYLIELAVEDTNGNTSTQIFTLQVRETLFKFFPIFMR